MEDGEGYLGDDAVWVVKEVSLLFCSFVFVWIFAVPLILGRDEMVDR